MITNKRTWIGILLGIISFWALDGVANPVRHPLDELDCIIEPQNVVEVSSATAGLLESVLVERGDIVKKGQLLARLQSGVEEANVKLAEMRANSEENIMEKQAQYEFNQRTQVRVEGLFRKKTIPELERDKTRTETLIAKYELEKAKLDNKIAQLELERAQEVLKLHSILSPIDGIVAEKYKSAGEYVHVIDERPVLKLAKIDLLHVEVIAPVALFGSIKPGMYARVTPEKPIGGDYAAKVVIVDQVMDAASGTFGIRLHLPNPKYTIPAGLRCRVNFLKGKQLKSDD